MADIFEEVEEGIRQDRLTILWKKYGLFAYLAGGLLIGGVALNEYLKDKSSETINTATLSLEAAMTDLEAGNYEASGTALEALINSDTRLAPIAAHFLAKVRLDGNGDAAAAADVLAISAAASNGPAEKLALLKSAYLVADSSTQADLEIRLAALRSDETAFGALALELIAAKALEEGDIEFARTEFNYLRLAPNVPNGVSKRANQALASLPPASLDPLLQEDPVIDAPEAEPAPAQETGE